MRLVHTFGPQEEAEGLNPQNFSHFLKGQGIENECEEVIVPEESPLYRIWVLEEDKLARAQDLFTVYKRHPEKNVNATEEGPNPPKTRGGALSPSPFAPLTVLIILICILTFLWSNIHEGIRVPPEIKGVVTAPVLKSIVKELAFDYPHYFELRDRYIDLEKNDPQAASRLLNEMKQTPFWNGFYERYVTHHKNPAIPLGYSGPLFEKISQGEAWRLFSPAVLHYNFFHIFFNLLWFVMLGNQIEWRLGKWRYLFLMALIALVSNVAQYLMSGSFFMGLSGVVVGLAAFIWARQQKAPWEGYLFQKANLVLLSIFILGIFALQVVFFILQLLGNTELNLPIANTAHLVGGIVGYILGRLPLFGIRRQRS